MFEKILIANRGEIAVRILRTCREMGLPAVAVYEPADQSSLHVRLADEAHLLRSERSFFDQEALLAIAHKTGCDALHPGYGFLAENAGFAAACAAAGITFIGPPAPVLQETVLKLPALHQAAATGLPTVTHSEFPYLPDEEAGILAAAQVLGYPVVLKSCLGGRGPGERLVRRPAQLQAALDISRSEARTFYGGEQLFLERAILPAHQVGVQIVADRFGHIIHLGDREGSILIGNRKIVEESPAPSLTTNQREAICRAAVAVAQLFHFENVGTVEFLVDQDGRFFFSEIKARLQVEHPLTEMRANLDLVRLQIEIAAGRRLSLRQSDINLEGHAMLARIRAENPRRHHLPAPGTVRRVRYPGGHGVRVDSCVTSGSTLSGLYDPLFAKITAIGMDRPACLACFQQGLREMRLDGTATNLLDLRQVAHSEAFAAGRYATSFRAPAGDLAALPAADQKRLAAAAAVLYVCRSQRQTPTQPAAYQRGWHRESRRLP